MISTKELCLRSNLSRATLNNYIALGILPRPKLRPAEPGDGNARRLGYFPEQSVSIIDGVRELKSSGKSMEDIGRMFARGFRPANHKTDPNRHLNAPNGPKRRAGRDASVRLTLEGIEGPAYLVNHRFQIEWCNDEAMCSLLDPRIMAQGEIAERNVLRLLLEGNGPSAAADLQALLHLHVRLAMRRLSKSGLLTLDQRLTDEHVNLISEIYDQLAEDGEDAPRSVEVTLLTTEGRPCLYRVHTTHFREGIFFAFSPIDEREETLQAFLSRRDVVIRELLKNRQPYLTPMCVLVADLQDSMKICAELPPVEYFELINHIWSEMEPVFRRYSATRGKHVGDGIVYYFFPQPDSNFTLNALRCAHEMSAVIARIDEEWRQRKNWSNRLCLNIGMDEGQEWFGTYQTPTHIEFTVLGDTVNRAARVSDLARDGAVWMTKNLVASLNSAELGKIAYGVRHHDEDGEIRTVSETYSRVSNLVDLENPRYHKFSDIAVLPITELLGCSLPEAENASFESRP